MEETVAYQNGFYVVLPGQVPQETADNLATLVAAGLGAIEVVTDAGGKPLPHILDMHPLGVTIGVDPKIDDPNAIITAYNPREEKVNLLLSPDVVALLAEGDLPAHVAQALIAATGAGALHCAQFRNTGELSSPQEIFVTFSGLQQFVAQKIESVRARLTATVGGENVIDRV